MNSILCENELLTKFISIFILFLEIQIIKTFFIHAFNLVLTKKNDIIFSVFCFLIESLIIIFTPITISPFINIAVSFGSLLFFFRQNFTKSIFILVIPISIFQLLKLFFIFILSSIFIVPPLSLLKIPIVKPIIIFPTYFIMFALLDYLKKLNFSEVFSKDLSFLNKIVINVFSFSALFSIMFNTYMVYNLFNQLTFSFLFTFIFLNIFILVVLVMLIVQTSDLKKAKDTIDYEQKSYASLSHSYDSIREFKHDFSNIMQSIGGYLFTDDLDGLKIYYSSIFKECEELKKLAILNKDVLNSPPVLSLITEKYYKAKELGIEFNIEVFIDFTTLHMDIYEFTRILGIFLDNSIEAAEKSSKKIINILITKDARNHFDSIVIENSCQSANIDTVKIFDKNFSTKPKNSGIGLWKVKKILNHYDNILLNTSVNNNLFRHQLKIYY